MRNNVLREKGEGRGSLLFLFPFFFLLLSCGGGDYTPKPTAYLRIDMPEHQYASTLDSSFLVPHSSLPFVFEVNRLAELSEKEAPRGEVWLDIKYPQWDGVVFLTYKRLTSSDDLRGQTDTSLRLLEKHYQFASGVEEQHYEDPLRRVYGATYRLGGPRVASTYQFWLTDSSSNFMRGALYINHAPNNDSLAPVLEYLQADLDHLIETLRWSR